MTRIELAIVAAVFALPFYGLIKFVVTREFWRRNI